MNFFVKLLAYSIYLQLILLSQDIVLIAISIGALFSLVFHLGVDEIKESEVYHLHTRQSKSPPAMRAYDWLKEKQFYQVLLFEYTLTVRCMVRIKLQCELFQ